MSENLISNTPSGSDLYTHVGSFKHTPMLVFDAIVQELRASSIIILVAGIGDPGTVGHDLFSIWCDPDQLCGVHH